MKPAPRPDPVVRFETEPGQQVQVDWVCSDSMARVYRRFYLPFGWSRYAYGVFVDNERFDTLSHCHELAFEEFGGITL